MTIQTIQNNIERVRREILTLQRRYADETKNETTKTERILRVKQTMTSSSSQSTINSKLREISQIEHDILSIQRKKIDLTKKIADKTGELHKHEQQLFHEQEREQKRLQISSSAKNKKPKKSRMGCFDR